MGYNAYFDAQDSYEHKHLPIILNDGAPWLLVNTYVTSYSVFSLTLQCPKQRDNFDEIL